ncbi:serine hydrolase domain-containing protein [soil metagenome]
MSITEDLGFSSERLERLDAVLHRYVDDGSLPGVQTLVSRRGQLVHRDLYGLTDIDAGIKVQEDTIYRIFSMTKPITSVALMMLFEEGAFLLSDPISQWLPEFADMEVWVGGTADAPETRPLTTPITVHHVLTHTSGLTYGFQYQHPVDELYRGSGIGDFSEQPFDLSECMRLMAAIPLQFEPGTQWNYSMATDVCGALIERMSGLSLAEFFRTRIFDPLGMVDTGFAAPPNEVDRCSTLYVQLPGMEEKAAFATREAMTVTPPLLSGGGGLVSTADDYLRFSHMLLGGGELDGVRLLSPHTLRMMTLNHLPDGKTLNEMGQATFSEVAMAGAGFGLGFSVLVDQAANRSLGPEGLYSWGGAASTAFWVDPVEQVAVVFMTQLLPSGRHPLRIHLMNGVYQALID